MILVFVYKILIHAKHHGIFKYEGSGRMPLSTKDLYEEEFTLLVKNLETSVKTDDGLFQVVKGADLKIKSGETVGLVGESGCGKSITALSIMGLLPTNARISSGQILLDGTDLVKLTKEELRKKRGKDVSMIFQEPMTSLNPVFTIGNQITELILNHEKISKKDAKSKAVSLMKQVGIPRADEIFNEYPHQLSGGMRQRIMITIGLACNPKLLIADEPTTALDVTIQAQILELMKEIQNKFSTSILLITHDLGVVGEVCDRVYVMYGGNIIEEGKVPDIFQNPKHPYTKGLLQSTPQLGNREVRLHTIPGRVPPIHQMPSGCRFSTRCPFVMEKCKTKNPELVALNENSKVRCVIYDAETEVDEVGKESITLG